MNPVDRCAWGRGSHSLSSATCPLSPGALSRVWNVEVKTKVPDRVSNRQGGLGWAGKQHPKPPSPGDPTIPKLDRSRLDSLWPASSYTPSSATPSGPLRIYLHLSAPLRSSPGIRTRASWCDPQPGAHSSSLPCLSSHASLLLLLFFPRLPATTAYYVPSYPALLCCICSLTASPPRLASPSITCVNRPPGQPAHSHPPSRHHWNAQ